jgi:6-phosphogluconate dehydrogenase
MKLAMVGLGRMGMNMARRLLRSGHEVVAYNRTRGKIDEVSKDGAIGVYDLKDLSDRLVPPRIVWLMVPAGTPVDESLDQLKGILSAGDIVVDAGNSHFKDDIRRKALLAETGIVFVDVGVSGGIWSLKEGYCLMVGGDRETSQYLEPVFRSLAPVEGYLYCGSTGAGHFVKMVHNAIQYGMMQAYAKGFDILDKSRYGESMDYSRARHLWNRGSIIRSWLPKPAEDAFAKDARLSIISGTCKAPARVVGQSSRQLKPVSRLM